MSTFIFSLSLSYLVTFSLQAMGCCGIKGDKEGEEDDKRARKQNKEIEKQIQKDKQVMVKLMMVMSMVRTMMTIKKESGGVKKFLPDFKVLVVQCTYIFPGPPLKTTC